MVLTALSQCVEEAYTPFEHLYRSLFLSTDDLCLMFTAYFDVAERVRGTRYLSLWAISPQCGCGRYSTSGGVSSWRKTV